MSKERVNKEIDNIFEVDTGENCICADCGEEKYLQFGVCIKCGGNVIDKDEYLADRS